jgi:hypothetical protein
MPKKLLQGDDLNKYLDDLEAAGMAVTKKWHSMWRTAVMYVWNEQLGDIKKNPDWEYIVINYIYPLMMQGIAKLSKNNPKVLGRPWKDEDAEYAEKWQGVIQYAWEQLLNMREDVIYALLDSSVFGYSVGKICWQERVKWDEQNKKWLGDVKHQIVHPANFWADPTATRIKDARNLGTMRKVRLDWAISQWPDFEEKLKEEAKLPNDYNELEYSDGLNSAIDNQPIYQNQSAGTIKRYFSKIVSLMTGRDTNSSADAGKDKIEYVWLKETYFKDEYEKHVKIEDFVPEQTLLAKGEVLAEDGTGILKWAKDGTELSKDNYPKQTLQEYDQPLFPRGRYVLRAGKTILNPDLDDQAYSFSRWPFNVLVHHILPHMWQGSNAVEFSKSSQDMLNSTVAHLIQHIKLNADPQKIVEAQTLAKDKKGRVREIKGKAGEIIIVKKGRQDAIRNLESGRLGTEVFSLIEYLRKDIETQQFMHPTAQGASAGRQVTAQEAARMDTNAHDMIAMRSVLLDKWIEGTAINIAEMLQKYYDIERKLRVIGIDGETRNIMMNAELKQVEWDLEIEPGSTLPFDEERKKNDYMAAYKILENPNPNALLEDMLRILNIANRSKILSKHKQIQIFKQFIQLSQQVQGILQQAQQAQQAGTQVAPEQMAAVQGQIMQQVMQLMQQVTQITQGAAVQT